MHVLIGADLVPTESNYPLFTSGDAKTLLGEKLQTVLAQAQYRIFNLEVPLADKNAPIEKWGPHLAAPTAAICGYQAIGADAVAVANNHILDQGVQGLESTLRVLKENNIGSFGAGDTLKEAAEPYFLALGDKKIGFYACTEHEFSVATESHAGANPFDPLETPDHVQALKAQCDYVIVLYHGGKENYRYPSPGLQKVCRKLVEKGADLVICQHSHCIGCLEEYRQGTIVYGQGNFLFDHSEREGWQTGLLIRLDQDFCVSYLPLVKEGNTVRLAEGDAAERILEQFARRSAQIREPGEISRLYDACAREEKGWYLQVLAGKRSLVLRLANRLTGGRLQRWLTRKRFSGPAARGALNYISCESHRELLTRILEQQ